MTVATVSDKPPGVEARAATGGSPWLLLAMAAAAVWYVLVIEGKEWAAYNTCLIFCCPSTGLSRRVRCGISPNTTHGAIPWRTRAAAQNEAIIATATAEYREKLLCARAIMTL